MARGSIVCLALAVSLLPACSATRSSDPRAAGLEAATRSWVSPSERRHPLAGAMFQPSSGAFVSADAVVAAATAADFVLLGEQHDNADHHRLQAALLRELLARGRRPFVAFEQIDLEQQEALAFVQAESGEGSPAERASRLAEALAWEKRGWPPFDQYRPVFEVALGADLPMKAANLSRAAMREMFAAGTKDLPEAPGLPPLTDAQRRTMQADIVESHCGHAPDGLVAAMIEGQRRRDAAMAGVLLRGSDAADAQGRERRGVLLCGFAHARKDYGVPVHLAAEAPERRAVSIAFVEVSPEGRNPADYARALHAPELPFDFVLFTPRVDDEDPCEKFRASLEKMKAPGPGAVAPR
jgi:uncharacterized iron-regulated protein